MPTDPFDLNLRHLRAVAEIVARGSMSAAAEAVSLSQPALTQGIAKLERRLGVDLFDRRPDGMRPTAEGARLAARTLAAFAHLAAGRGERSPRRGFARPEQLMTAAQLRAFVGVADAGSFVGAAGLTGLSQPALHRAVRDLEQIAGIELVQRRGRGVALTAAGRRLARGSRLAAGEIAAGIVEAAAGHVRGPGRIVVGAMPLSRALLLPRAIAASCRSPNGAEVTVVEGSWRELVDPLRDGVIDIMIGALRDDAALPDLVQTHLFVDRLVVVARAGHPLTAVVRPDRAALAAYPWIVGLAGTPLRDHWQLLFEGGPMPAAPVACGSVMTIRGILHDSDFLTLLSRDQVTMEIETGTLAIIDPPQPERGTRRIGITRRRNWRPTQPQADFLALLAAAVDPARIAGEPA